MKHKGLIITTIIFFLLINTSYFWEGKLEGFAIPAFLLLVLLYFVLASLLIHHLLAAVKEKFKDKQRIILVGILTVVLSLIFLKPSGIIDFDRLSGKDLIFAQREGGGNCTTTLKLKDSKKFIERSVCFGVTEVTGNYELRGDTILFNVDLGRQGNVYYKYGVIKKAAHPRENIIGDLVLYKGLSDTVPLTLWITTNELLK